MVEQNIGSTFSDTANPCTSSDISAHVGIVTEHNDAMSMTPWSKIVSKIIISKAVANY